MVKVINDMGNEVELFFNDLNWRFIIIYVFILYGMKHKEEFNWYNELFKSNPFLDSLKTWITGIILMAFF
jgi:hypothetical protein